ncbi:diablo IAP-binding mitochondrial protein-like isoform X2 [Rhodnius prolixus]|uniref:diablo IAP-binding mitochondrial protein-like isoform X2 n=1 Tax=Rhodnius prolixus TaxID=13249 RepID=UPI003D18D64C
MIALRKLGIIRNSIPRIIRNKFFRVRGKPLYTFFPVALCVSNNEKLKKIEAPKVLTHEYLLQQASSVAVNAATQLLTQTVVAILDTAEDYKLALLDLISLLRESKEVFGENRIQEDLSDLIIATRAKTDDFKNQLIQLETLLNYVEKVVVSTAETSFLSGAEFVSTSLSERLYSAKIQVDEVMRNIKVLETEFLSLQKEVIIETTECDKNSF